MGNGLFSLAAHHFQPTSFLIGAGRGCVGGFVQSDYRLSSDVIFRLDPVQHVDCSGGEEV